MKFWKKCGKELNDEAVICPHCGCQIEEIKSKQENTQSQIVINNNSQPVQGKKLCSKWVSFTLCLFLGYVGAHKFYEGNIGTGLLYLCTFGLFFIGVFIDLFNILGKPDPYEA